MQTENRTKTPAKWLALACLLLLLLGVAVWFLRRPKSVAVVHRERVPISETIASSARIGGVQDSRSGNEVFSIMREMNREKGVAFIMVTHDDRLAQEAIASWRLTTAGYTKSTSANTA